MDPRVSALALLALRPRMTKGREVRHRPRTPTPGLLLIAEIDDREVFTSNAW
jgi:hypothetical protein